MPSLSQSIITRTECPVCESSEFSEVLIAKDYTVSQEQFPVMECGQCGFRFTQQIPDEETIGAYYQSEEYISHSNTNQGLISRLYQVVRDITLRSKRKLVQRVSGKSTGHLLDIGSGTGEFLATMKGAGWKVRGLEPDPGARNQAIENHQLDVGEPEELFTLEENTFDVISMWHVLEHVHRLKPYLHKISNLLKADGVLLIAVPNFTSRDAEHYDAYWAAYDVPRHLYHFSPESMNRLLGDQGFEIVSYRPMPFDAFYVSMLSEKYQHGKLKLVSAFWQGFRSWLKASANAKACSSVLYVIRKRA